MPQNSSSSSYSTHSQSLQPEATTYKPVLHDSTSSSQTTSFGINLQQSSSVFPPDRDEDESETDEIDEIDNIDGIDEYELILLKEAEITDEQGSILRTQKMRTKDVYKLNAGEKILVHVNQLGQPIKAAGGLCTRFMSHLLKKPNMCSLEARDWKEVKVGCGVLLLGELRRKFILPQRDDVDKVLLAIFGNKYRTLKQKFKQGLFRSAANRLNEVNNIGNDVAHNNHYTEEDLLQALDLLEVPSNFDYYQWELYKHNLRTPAAKKLSECGKKARAQQVHTHTTWAVSFARIRDEFKVTKKRDADDVELFDIAHQTKKGVYVQDTLREFMERAKEEISKKISASGRSEPIDHKERFEIAREVMVELMGPDKPGRARGHGAGVTKSQVTKFSFDLRRMRSEASTNQNRLLEEKVESQSKEIKSQREQLKVMNQTLDQCTRQLKLFSTAFQGMYTAQTSKEMFFTTPGATENDLSNKQQLSPGVLFKDFV